VQSLPLVVSLIVAALVAGPLVRSLRDHGLVRENYRGAALPFPIGIAIPVAALVALIPLALVQELAGAEVFRPAAYPAVTYVIGVALLGLLDDFVGSGVFRGQGTGDRGQGTGDSGEASRRGEPEAKKPPPHPGLKSEATTARSPPARTARMHPLYLQPAVCPPTRVETRGWNIGKSASADCTHASACQGIAPPRPKILPATPVAPAR
jgi:hypothetical protein